MRTRLRIKIPGSDYPATYIANILPQEVELKYI